MMGRWGFCWAGLVLAGTAALADDYPAWAHRKDIYYDTSPAGAGVAGDVNAFPVLVRLDSAGFPFAEARGDGSDLRFSKPDGTPVPFEIDVYDSAAHAAAVWVLADTVKGNGKGDLLRMYWGNPAATSASEPGKVFSAANGFSAVWHLRGQYPNPRVNAVPGGQDAVPVNYDADEQTRGVIGFADSLDGGNPGDYLQTWQPFDSLSKAFTFSVWAYPTAVAAGARFMDFGNGAASDNLVLGRADSSNDLRFENFKGAAGSGLTAPGALALNEWQYFAVSVSGKTARIYRNGAEVAAGDLADTITAVRRGSNFLGRGNWSDNAYYRGKLDEPEVAAAARGPDWIKLAYANQRPDQKLLSFIPPVLCEPRFGATGDTAAPEGATLELAGTADCADQFGWSWVSGPAVRILNPEAETLSLKLPRVTADTDLVLRFSATYGDSVRTRDLTIAVKSVVPQPKFTLPAAFNWNGRDSLLVSPSIANLPALQASPFPALRAAWTLSGPEVDTAWAAEGLWLLAARAQGDLSITLCLDNGGPPVCASTQAGISDPTRLLGKLSIGPALSRPGYGADGRFYRAGAGSAPRFIRPRESSSAPSR